MLKLMVLIIISQNVPGMVESMVLNIGDGLGLETDNEHDDDDEIVYQSYIKLHLYIFCHESYRTIITY